MSQFRLLPENHWRMLDDAEKGLLIANYIASPLLDMYSIDSSTLRFVQMDHLGTVLICSGNGKKCSRDNCDSSNDKNVRSTTTANDTPFFIRLSNKSSASPFSFSLQCASSETFEFMGLHFSTNTIYSTLHKGMYIEIKETVNVFKRDPKIDVVADMVRKDFCPQHCHSQELQKKVSKPDGGSDFGTIGKKRVFSDASDACEDVENMSASTLKVVKRYKRSTMYENRHALHVLS